MPYAVNATMRPKWVCVGQRRLAESTMRLLTVWRGSLEKVTHKQRLCVAEAKHRGMRWIDYCIETKWWLSRWYIYKWTENSIVLITFQSLSWVHSEAKHRREVEEDVHVDLEWNSRRFHGGNLSWSRGLSWCYSIRVTFDFGGRTN